MNWPNRITLIRILSIPVIAFCLLKPFACWREIAWIFFTLASVSDFVDGYLARKQGSVTFIGTILDPIADKLLTISCIGVLIYTHELFGVYALCAMIIVWRELFIAGLREGIRAQHISLPVSFLAKAKTVCQLCAIAGFILGDDYNLLNASKVVMITATALSLWTGWQYVQVVRKECSWA